MGIGDVQDARIAEALEIVNARIIIGGLRANARQIVFLSIEDLDRAKEMLKGIEETLAWLSGSRDRSRLRPSGSPEPDAHRRSRVHGLSV